MIRKMIACLALVTLLQDAQAQPLKTPAPSTTQSIKQDFGIATIELTYSRPDMRGRKIFGGLVPYGQLWRTGANAATRIKFTDDVTISGVPVKAGEYVLYTIPNANEWEVVLNKGINNWGAEGYQQTDDVARFKVKPMTLSEPIETFTMQFANVKPSAIDLHIMWERTAIAIPITNDVETKVMAQINNAMNKDNRPYYQAAMYYIDNGKDMNQAITWLNKAIEQNPDGFYIYYQKANALAKLGRKEEARQSAQKSMELARKQNNNEYIHMNEKLLADLK